MTEGYICTSTGSSREIEAVIIPNSAGPAAIEMASRIGGPSWVQDEYLSKCWNVEWEGSGDRGRNPACFCQSRSSGAGLQAWWRGVGPG